MRFATLSRQVTIEEIEYRQSKSIPEDRLNGLHDEMHDYLAPPQIAAVLEVARRNGKLPFGARYGKWHQLKNDILPGDELWEFQASSNSDRKISAVHGYVLMREGKVVSSIMADIV